MNMTWNKCGRVYPLQGLLLCAYCGSPMSPHYVYHKAGGTRRTESYIHHYVCSQYRKYGKDCDHANRVVAKNAEAWMVDRIKNLVESEDTVALALQSARLNSAKDLAPAQEELNRTHTALQKVQGEIDSVVTTITSGGVAKAMVNFLNERANQLQSQREKLRIEQRRLMKELSPAEDHFDAESFRKVLANFDVLVEEARPEELQQILRLLMRKGNGKIMVRIACTFIACQKPKNPHLQNKLVMRIGSTLCDGVAALGVIVLNHWF